MHPLNISFYMSTHGDSHSGLSTWKYQFSCDHWSKAMLNSINTWNGEFDSSAVWVLLLTLKVGYIWLAILYWLCALCWCRIGNCCRLSHGWKQKILPLWSLHQILTSFCKGLLRPHGQSNPNTDTGLNWASSKKVHPADLWRVRYENLQGFPIQQWCQGLFRHRIPTPQFSCNC